MVDLPARQDTALRRKKAVKRKPFTAIDKDKFRLLRKMNRLTKYETAELLHVVPSTITAWERGDYRIPYSAFKLLRIMVNGEFLSEAWEGWQVKGSYLCPPTGRPFQPYQLVYLSNYMQMARLWIKERERIAAGRTVYRMTTKLSIVTDLGKRHAAK